MENFKELSKIVSDLDKKEIWAYMLEIATVIDGREDLSDEQKQDAYVLAFTEFENYDDGNVGANVFAEAAIETIFDEKYSSDDDAGIHELFEEKLSNLLY